MAPQPTAMATTTTTTTTTTYRHEAMRERERYEPLAGDATTRTRERTREGVGGMRKG